MNKTFYKNYEKKNHFTAQVRGLEGVGGVWGVVFGLPKLFN
jgi:hypothetical protein